MTATLPVRSRPRQSSGCAGSRARSATHLVLDHLDSLRSETMISGGSSDTDETALAVEPNGRPWPSTAVTTVTPVAKCPIVARSCPGSTVAIRV